MQTQEHTCLDTTTERKKTERNTKHCPENKNGTELSR